MANIPAAHYDRYELNTWFERDRAHVGLKDSRTGKEVLDLWDDDVRQLVEDGFLDPKDYHGSAIEYAMHLGAIPKPRKNPGSRWHGRQATEAEEARVHAEDRGSIIGSHFFRGKREAHRESQDASRAMGLNPFSLYDVFLRGKKIDTVSQSDPSSAEEVKRSLVEHDGYDPDIRVVKQRRKSLPPLFRRRRNPGADSRKPQGGVHAYVKDRGRVWVESINSLKGTALVRFDPGEGIRSRVTTVPLASVDFTREWRINPGAAWHRDQAKLAEDMEKRETRPRQRTYLRGMTDAHTLSAHESRKMGLNPRKSEADETAARELLLFIENSESLYRQQLLPIYANLDRKRKRGVYDREKAVKLFLYLADNGARLYNKEVMGQKGIPTFLTRATRLLVARDLRNRYETEERAKPNPRARRRGVRNPDIEMTFNSKAKAVRYASAMRKLGHDIEVVKGQYGTWKTIIHEPRKNPIAVYNPPPGRIIYGRVLAVEAQKTNGSHRGKRFRHSFAGDSRVAAYALPDGSVLLKSAAGKRLWADR